eukprot:3876771-Prymnesium_polylepis.1
MRVIGGHVWSLLIWGHVGSRGVTCGHVGSRGVMCGHVWSQRGTWGRAAARLPRPSRERRRLVDVVVGGALGSHLEQVGPCGCHVRGGRVSSLGEGGCHL